MRRSSSATREILRHAERFRGSTVFIAPSGIGPIERDDLEMFLQDADLLTKLGMRLVLVDYEHGTFWDVSECPKSLQRLSVLDEGELIATAVKYGTSKLCLVAGTDRISTSKGRQLDDVSLSVAKQLLDENALGTEESRRALACAVLACQAGIPRVHIFNMHRDGALLDELFTDLGAGTMIYAGTPHKEVRTMVPSDRFSMCSLLRSVIPRRTVEFVRNHQKELRVFTVDGDVHGIARLSRRGNTVFVLSLAHSSRSSAAEVLESLLRAALEEARTQQADTVAIPVDEIPALMRILPWFTELKFKKGHVSIGVGRQDAWLKQVA